jgi:hypothetical protein
MPVVTDFINELHDPEALLRHFYILIAGAGVGPAPPKAKRPCSGSGSTIAA